MRTISDSWAGSTLSTKTCGRNAANRRLHPVAACTIAGFACFLAGQRPCEAGINDGLQAHWGFNFDTGDVVQDESGHGHNGTKYAGASFAPGMVANGCSFNGTTTGYVDTHYSPVIPQGQSLSIALWAKMPSTPPVDTETLTGFEWMSSVGELRLVLVEITGKVMFIFQANDGTPNGAQSGQNVCNGGWRHIVGIRNCPTDRVQVYIDGVLSGSAEDNTTGTLNPAGVPPIFLGASNYRNDTVASPFSGVLDEVRVYNRTLTTSEIELLMTIGPPGTPPSNNVHLGEQEYWSGSTDDPVNTATGNFYHDETDLSILTRSLPLEFKRYYNSLDSGSGPLGPGWTHSYRIVLTDHANGQVSVRWGDGRADYWQDNGQSIYVAAIPGLYDSLVKNPDNTWTVTRKSLDAYGFDATGRLTSITDKNTNATTLAYDNTSFPSLVTQVTDPAGRAITLAYDGAGLLTSLSDFASPPRVVHYTYSSTRLTQVTDVLGHTVNYGYDANGYLTTVADQRGITAVTNTYDAQGRVTQQLDGNNRLTQLTYDTPATDQTTITDARGKTTVHTHFTGHKLLWKIRDELGHTTVYAYDSAGNRIVVTDRNNNSTSFTYDARGNVLTTKEADNPADPNDGGVTIVEYGDARFPDFPTKKTDALGRITTWQYDAKGNVIWQVDPKLKEHLWTYNSFGQKLTEQDERGPAYVTQYIYDADGKLTEIVNAESDHTWFSYDALWRVTSMTDGRGTAAGDPNHTTTTAYDNADRVTSVTGPITSESYQYDNIGNRTHVTNGRGYTSVSAYDNNSNLTRVERPAPGGVTQVTQYGYDELNRRVSMTDPNNHVTTYQYDDADRLTRVIDAATNQTVYTHDAHGNVLTATDGAGVTVTHEYDPLNRKIHQYDELNNHWYWQYDKLGRMTRHTDANGKQTGYTYDEFGRLTGVTQPDGNSTAYQYDEVGNLTLVKTADGKTVAAKTYDNANRLTRQEDGLGHAFVYGYDGAGNQTSVLDANNQTTTLVYDNENRLTEIHYPDTTQVTFVYDANDNLTTMVDPTGTTTYLFDALDRLTSSTDSFGKPVQYGYDLAGNRTALTYPADAVNPARTVTYAYDPANRLDTITDWAARITDYTFDGAGRLTQVTYPNGVKETRAYDNAGRLQTLYHAKSDATPLLGFTYSRDAQGNPTNIAETGTLEPNLAALVGDVHYSYDADNRLTGTDEPATYTHDNNGNMTGRTSGGVTTAFTYDVEDRMVSQTTGPSTVQHVYDGKGNRIARIDNGTATRYVLDRGRDMSHVLCETDASGNIVAYYIHGPQIVGRIGTDGSQRYYHGNQVTSVAALTDETQTITDRYAYTSFGTSAGREGNTANPFTYVGGLGLMAEADGLCFVRARFYDPGTGRFLGKDPVEGALADPLGLHRYVYGLSNPLINADPSGLVNWGQVAWGSFEVVAGAAAACSGGPVGVLLGGSSLYKGVGDIKAGFKEDPSKQYTLIQDVSGLVYVGLAGGEATDEGLAATRQAVGLLEALTSFGLSAGSTAGSLGNSMQLLDRGVLTVDQFMSSVSLGGELRDIVEQILTAFRNVRYSPNNDVRLRSDHAKGVLR